MNTPSIALANGTLGGPVTRTDRNGERPDDRNTSRSQSDGNPDSGSERYGKYGRSDGRSSFELGHQADDHADSSQDRHREGPVARAIEEETAKLPSDTFLWAAGGAIATSLALQLYGSKQTSNFIGQWAPTILILGLYNKLVKLEGHDRSDRRDRRDRHADRHRA